MKLTTTIIALCVAATSVGAAGIGVTHCNANNCIRALFPTQDASRFASGAAFCATYYLDVARTAPVTNAPPSATKACGSDPKVYSSACHCVPILPTPTLEGRSEEEAL